MLKMVHLAPAEMSALCVCSFGKHTSLLAFSVMAVSHVCHIIEINVTESLKMVNSYWSPRKFSIIDITVTYKILLPSYSSVIHCRVEKHLLSHGNLNMNTSTKTNMKVAHKSTQKIHITVQESYSKCGTAVSA